MPSSSKICSPIHRWFNENLLGVPNPMLQIVLHRWMNCKNTSILYQMVTRSRQLWKYTSNGVKLLGTLHREHLITCLIQPYHQPSSLLIKKQPLFFSFPIQVLFEQKDTKIQLESLKTISIWSNFSLNNFDVDHFLFELTRDTIPSNNNTNKTLYYVTQPNLTKKTKST